MATQTAENTVGLSLEILKHRFLDLKIFLDRVDWAQADLEAWAQNPEGAELLELVNVFLYALGVPDDQNLGPALDSMSQKAEVGHDSIARDVREAGLPASSVPESMISDGPPASGSDEPGAKSFAQNYLDFTRRLDQLCVEAGWISLDQLREKHRAVEERLRRHS